MGKDNMVTCFGQCGNCKYYIYDQNVHDQKVRDQNVFQDDHIYFSMSLCRELSNADFLMVIYIIYKAKVQFLRNIITDRSTVNCNRTISLFVRSEESKEFMLNNHYIPDFISQRNYENPERKIPVSPNDKKSICAEYSNETVDDFITMLRNFIIKSLVIDEHIFDYLRNTWEC